MMYRLIVLTGELKNQRITVEPEPMTIGRDEDCTVSVQDEEMARKHACIEHREDGLYIRDLGSMNKILVNKREVRQTRLQHGDMIEIGRTRFLVQALVQAEIDGKREISPRRKQWRAVGALVVFVLGLVVAMNILVQPGAMEEVSAAPVETADIALESQLGPVLPDPRVSEDLRLVREDLAAIRESMRLLTNMQTSSEPEPIVITPEALHEKAMTMLEDARAAVLEGKVVKADELYSGVQILEPDFYPAYGERARLFERRGMPHKAVEQWAVVVEANPSPELFEQAVGEKLRLQRKMQEEGQAGRTQLRLAAVDQRRMLTSEEYDEVRILKFSIKPQSPDLFIDPESVEIDVEFFDEDEDGTIRPTDALVPKKQFRVEGKWKPGEEKSFTATYEVPRGRRGGARYCGYRIRVLYDGALQDVQAKPKTLIKRAASDALPPNGES